MGKVKSKKITTKARERKIRRDVIGSFKNMKKVLANWKSVSADIAVQPRKNWIEHYLDMKYHVYDHNIALVWLFDTLKPESYLEIGVLNGGSLVHALVEPSIKRVVGIDAWARDTYAGVKTGKDFVQKEVVDKFAGKSVELIQKLSQQALRGMSEKFDIVTVDGDHSRAGAMADLKLVLPLVKQAIVFDDILHQSHLYLTDVAYEFAAENNLPMTINWQTPGTVIFWI